MSVVELAWTPPPESLFTEYVIYHRPDDSPEWQRDGSTRGTTYRFESFAREGRWTFGIAPVVNGIEASPEDWTTVDWEAETLRDFDVPANVTNFRAAQVGDQISCQWDAVEDARLQRYQLRQGASWEAGLVMAEIDKTMHAISVAWWAAGATTLWIKAYTLEGLESATAATVALTVRQDEYMPQQGTTDEHAAGFTGTKTNTEVSGGHLRPTQLPTAFSSWGDTFSTYDMPWWWATRTSATYTTAWKDAGVVADEKIEVTATMAKGTKTTTFADFFGQVAPLMDDTVNPPIPRLPGAETVYHQIDSAETLLPGVQLKVEIDTSQDATPTPDGFKLWVPGATYRYRQVRLKFTLDQDWPFAFPRIEGLVWRRCRRNLKDEGSIVISGTGGTAVTFATAFTTAPRIQLTAAGTAALIPTFQNVTAVGFDVRVYDAAGTETIGTLHWTATGV